VNPTRVRFTDPQLSATLPMSAGIEVGFYAGCVRTWRQLQAFGQNEQASSSRCTLCALETFLYSSLCPCPVHLPLP